MNILQRIKNVRDVINSLDDKMEETLLELTSLSHQKDVRATQLATLVLAWVATVEEDTDLHKELTEILYCLQHANGVIRCAPGLEDLHSINNVWTDEFYERIDQVLRVVRNQHGNQTTTLRSMKR